MGKIVKVRRGNQSETRFVTLPKEICDFVGIKIGTKLELTPFSTDRIEIRIIREV